MPWVMNLNRGVIEHDNDEMLLLCIFTGVRYPCRFCNACAAQENC